MIGAGRKAWETRRRHDAERAAAAAEEDARHVLGLYRSTFDGYTKEASRRQVLRCLLSDGCTIVLDYWGGGRSADLLVAAGLIVISVDDLSMRLFDTDGAEISVPRKLAAMGLAGREGGYRVYFGSAVDMASECDGLWADGHSPWTPDLAVLMRACAHMKSVNVTMLPSHDIWIGSIAKGLRDRRPGILRDLIREDLGRKVRLLAKYTNGKVPVWVFTTHQGRVAIGIERRLVDPEYRAMRNEKQKLRKRDRLADPDYRAALYASRRERYASDPNYRQKIAEGKRQARGRLMADQVRLAAFNAKVRLRASARRSDPAKRAAMNAYQREWMARLTPDKKAAYAAESATYKALHRDEINARRRTRRLAGVEDAA